MKVGIIGLQPRQIRDVKGRTFNGHEVEFYSEKTYTQEKIASFARRMDKVILLPGHVPKRLDQWITKTKLHTMVGGMSSVVRYLELIPRDTPEEPIRPLEVKKEEQSNHDVTIVGMTDRPKMLTVVDVVKAPKKLGQTIPRGRQSQYIWSPDIGIVHPNESGEHRYDLLDAAVPGDVLRLARPHGVDYQVWRTRITSTRYAREKSRGQILEAHYYEEYVDLLVVDPDPDKTLPADREVTSPVSTATIQKTAAERGGIMAVAGVTVIEASPVPTPPAEPAVEEEPASPAPSAPVEHAVVVPPAGPEDPTRAFWINVFLAYTDRMAPQQCAEMADSAVRELRDRYKV